MLLIRTDDTERGALTGYRAPGQRPSALSPPKGQPGNNDRWGGPRRQAIAPYQSRPRQDEP
jgi:hypothetical protein